MASVTILHARWCFSMISYLCPRHVRQTPWCEGACQTAWTRSLSRQAPSSSSPTRQPTCRLSHSFFFFTNQATHLQAWPHHAHQALETMDPRPSSSPTKQPTCRLGHTTRIRHWKWWIPGSRCAQHNLCRHPCSCRGCRLPAVTHQVRSRGRQCCRREVHTCRSASIVWDTLHLL